MLRKKSQVGLPLLRQCLYAIQLKVWPASFSNLWPFGEEVLLDLDHGLLSNNFYCLCHALPPAYSAFQGNTTPLICTAESLQNAEYV